MPPKHTRRAILVYLGLALGNPLGRSHAAPSRSMEDLLRAIREVESGGEPNGGRDAVGDNGRSQGPLQIGRAYHTDSRVPGPYENVRDYAYACRVCVAYWRRWVPSALKSLDFEVLARTHNGGVKGATKKATIPYWRKIQAVLNR